MSSYYNVSAANLSSTAWNISTNYWKANASLSTVLSNYITSTSGVDVNMNTNNLNLMSGKITMNGGIIYFNTDTNTLSTQYAGARIVLWLQHNHGFRVKIIYQHNSFQLALQMLL